MSEAGEASFGLFVVLEGIDGAGTTTQAERYAAHRRARRRLVHVTREPTSGPIGSQIRLVLTGRLALAAANQAELMALLFAADRLDHLEHRDRAAPARRLRGDLGPLRSLEPRLPVDHLADGASLADLAPRWSRGSASATASPAART